MEMKDILNRMLNHEELSREETRDIIVGITKSEFSEEQITALLTGLQMRGVTVDELLGFRDGILATGVPAILDCDRYIDVVGTGGDRKNTFNISTTSCFVIAGAGLQGGKARQLCGYLGERRQQRHQEPRCPVYRRHGQAEPQHQRGRHRLSSCPALRQGNEVCGSYPQGFAVSYRVQPVRSSCQS